MRLYIMQTGLYMRAEFPVPFPAYLVQTDDGKNVLIASGADEHDAAKVRDDQGNQSIPVDESDKVINHLRGLGLTPQDIHYVICTHFDWDHCGYHYLFTKAKFIVQKTQYILSN